MKLCKHWKILPEAEKKKKKKSCDFASTIAESVLYLFSFEFFQAAQINCLRNLKAFQMEFLMSARALLKKSRPWIRNVTNLKLRL